MFAAKHRRRPPVCAQRPTRAFAAPLAQLIRDGQRAGAIVGGEPERVAVVAFAAMQGLAALVNGGDRPGAAVDELVDHAVERLGGSACGRASSAGPRPRSPSPCGPRWRARGRVVVKPRYLSRAGRARLGAALGRRPPRGRDAEHAHRLEAEAQLLAAVAWSSRRGRTSSRTRSSR